MGKKDVISPVGIQTLEQKSIARRLPDLAGKTVCEVWNGVFKGDDTFPIIRELLRKNFPDTYKYLKKLKTPLNAMPFRGYCGIRGF